MTTARVLADPRVRLGAGTASVLVTAMAARPGRVGPGEAAAFRVVNDLPGCLIRIYPAQAVGIAIIGNATNYPIDAIARLALTRT